MIAVKLIGIFIEAIGDEHTAQQSILEWSNQLTYSQLYKSAVQLQPFFLKGSLPTGNFDLFPCHHK